MSSSSGSDSRVGKSSAPSKIKTQKISHRGTDFDFTMVSSRKNARKVKNSTSNPPSPEFQLVDNTPVLIASNSAFDYDNSLSSISTPSDMTIDSINELSNLNFVVSKNISTSTNGSNNISSNSSNAVQNTLQNNLHTFPSDHHGSISILVECIHVDKTWTAGTQ